MIEIPPLTIQEIADRKIVKIEIDIENIKDLLEEILKNQHKIYKKIDEIK